VAEQALQAKEKELYSVDPTIFALTFLKTLNDTLDLYKQGKLQGKTQEYEQQDIEGAVESLTSNLLGEYTFSFDTVVDLLPIQYKPIARVLKSRPVDQAIDVGCDILKEYLKEYTKEDDGKYPSLEKVMTKVMIARMVGKVKGVFKRR